MHRLSKHHEFPAGADTGSSEGFCGLQPSISGGVVVVGGCGLVVRLTTVVPAVDATCCLWIQQKKKPCEKRTYLL